jgi:hypothetical protein
MPQGWLGAAAGRHASFSEATKQRLFFLGLSQAWMIVLAVK